MRVVVVNHVTLDGVMQGPGRPDEDTRDGFRHGGWADGSDPAIGEAMGKRMGDGFAWLFGRRSYDDMLSHWNEVGGPFKDGLNNTQKYVASSHPDADLPWPNSTLLSGDVPAAVAALREPPGGNLVIMGSGAAGPFAAPPRPGRRAAPDGPPAGARLGPAAVRRGRRSHAARARGHAPRPRAACSSRRTSP